MAFPGNAPRTHNNETCKQKQTNSLMPQPLCYLFITQFRHTAGHRQQWRITSVGKSRITARKHHNREQI